ncbi:MAG: tyrosine-type recombinase/integrase [Candidatus Dormibacteria bacterium]
MYQRPSGRWAGQLTTGGGERKTVSGATEADVVDRLRRLQAELASGLPATPARLTVRTFMLDWLGAATRRLRPSTATRYRQLVERQIVPTWGHLRLSNLRPRDVDQGLAALQAGGLGPRTCGHVRAVMRAALNDGRRWGTVARNAAALASAPRVPHQAPKVLSPTEVQQVLGALPDPAMRRLCAVAVNSGLRQGELLGLSWDDLADGQLHVHHALQRIAGEYRLVEPKSAGSRRTIPLNPDAAEALEDQRQAQRLERLAAGGRWREPIPGLIFETATGRPRNGPALTHQFEGALATASLPVIRWHHLRHAFAGLMLASGSDLATVSHLLGHSSVSLTASTYAGIAPSLRKDAVERLGRLLGRDTAKED